MGHDVDLPRNDTGTTGVTTMEQLLQELGGWKELRRGELVDGVVMGVSQDSLLINVGGKSEGVIPLSEMQTLPPEVRSSLKVGATVSAVVMEPEGRRGPAVLSYDRARGELGWKVLQQAMEQGATVRGTIAGTNRGGAVVMVEGLQGFVPLSQLAPETRNRLQPIEGGVAELPAPVTLKVLELDRSRRRVVLSERAAWLEERAERKRQAVDALQEGQVVTGRVQSLSPFGAFVDLGNVEGLLHISELSWKPVRSPDEVVKVGDQVQVYVLRVDKGAGKVSLSLRQMQPHPWDTVASRYEVGQLVKGKITRLTSFGAFVQVEPGVEGLVHISELSTKPITHPHQAVKEGDVCTTRILRVDTERRRLGLSLKQAVEELGESTEAPDNSETIA